MARSYQGVALIVIAMLVAFTEAGYYQRRAMQRECKLAEQSMIEYINIFMYLLINFRTLWLLPAKVSRSQSA